MPTVSAIPDRLRVNSPAMGQAAKTGKRTIGVDRKARVLRGYVVAQLGPFKSEGRGEFDQASLERIVELMAASPAGLKSRFAHPTESGDGLGKFLGRSRDPYLSSVVQMRDGKPVEIPAVRADLYLSASAFEKNPNGNLGDYILQLAEEDPEALSSSLVLKTKEEFRRNGDGTLAQGDDGKDLPPLWRPVKLFASDLVDTGDAVDGLLSAGGTGNNWTAKTLSHGTQLLDGMFTGQPREVVETRCLSWLIRYLDQRFEKGKKMSPQSLAPYDEGMQAFKDGMAEDANPYPADSAEAADWAAGFSDARAESEAAPEAQQNEGDAEQLEDQFFECNSCGEIFVGDAANDGLACPACGSTDIFQTSSKKQKDAPLGAKSSTSYLRRRLELKAKL